MRRMLLVRRVAKGGIVCSGSMPLRCPRVQGELLLPLRFLRSLRRLCRRMKAGELRDEAEVERAASLHLSVATMALGALARDTGTAGHPRTQGRSGDDGTHR